MSMKYYARVNRRIRNVRVYHTINKVGEKENALTKLFIRIFNPKASKSAEAAENSSRCLILTCRPADSD